MTPNNSFYTDFAPYYDKLVSYENRKEFEGQFWKDLLKKYKISDAHDCACGTGHHVMLFNEMGIRCSGADISEDMIRKTNENCQMRGIEPKLFQADFRDIKSTLNKPVDLIVNLGNSLAYLRDGADIIGHLKGSYARLTQNGIMVIETRNFDYLLIKKPRFIPLSLRDNYGFIYVLDYLKEKIRFNIIYLNLENKNFQTFQTEYFPLKYESLINFINQSGFRIGDKYADYKLGEFILESSPRLILILEKEDFL